MDISLTVGSMPPQGPGSRRSRNRGSGLPSLGDGLSHVFDPDTQRRRQRLERGLRKRSTGAPGLPPLHGGDGRMSSLRKIPRRKARPHAQLAQVRGCALAGHQICDRHLQNGGKPTDHDGARPRHTQLPPRDTLSASDANKTGELVLGQASSNSGRTERLPVERDRMSGHRTTPYAAPPRLQACLTDPQAGPLVPASGTLRPFLT